MLLIRPSFSFENIRHIYFVAAHKLILNVSKIRLRLICARASYLYRLFAKALFGNVQGCTFPNNGIRAATEKSSTCQNCQGRRGFHAESAGVSYL